MGEEITRERFTNRKPGVVEFSRGQQRKQAKQEVTVSSPQGGKSVAKKHKPTIKGTSGLDGLSK